MASEKYYQKVLDLLSTGRKEAVPMRTLAQALNVRPREIRQAVLDARMDGVIVCSGMGGYFFPKSDEEVLKFYRVNRARAMTTLKSLKASHQIVKRM